MKRINVPLLILFLTSMTAIGAKAQLLMRGDVDYDLFGSRIRVFVEQIENLNDTPTGPLRLRVILSKHPFDETNRKLVAAATLIPRLQANQRRFHLHPTTHMHLPSADWYYVTVTLDERVTDDSGQRQWITRDQVEFDQDFIGRINVWPFN